MAPYAIMRPLFVSSRPRLALAALICAAGIAAPFSVRTARASDCGPASGPSGAAGTSALYGELARSVSAEPLSVDITARSIGGSCAWVYEVKVLTAAGSVALLDFDLVDLSLRHVDGPVNDPDIAKLYDRLGQADRAANDAAANGDAAGDDVAGDDSSGESGSGKPDSGSDDDNSSGGEGGQDSGGSEGGSGSGNSGSGSSGSGSSGSGGSGSGSSGSGSGGEGGEGGGGGGHGGGGEGGEGGGHD